MALRIEHLLFITSVAIGIAAFTVVLKEDKKSKHSFTKELVFTNTTFTEVDTKVQMAQAYTTYGVRDNMVLHVKNLEYKTDKIKSLVAKKGKLKGDMVYLTGDVVLHTDDGYIYKTEAANYNEKTEILNITAPYVATQNKNVIEGDALTYHIPSNETNSTGIDAVLYTIEK
ncbi:MAG: hypothetical protein GQ531_00435 [Sulfurovum sp.]|nr:hypothetical protein [Sulfurovum sp.]